MSPKRKGTDMSDVWGEAIHAAGGHDVTLVTRWPRQSMSRRFHVASAVTEDGRPVSARAERDMGLAVERLIRRLHHIRGVDAAVPELPADARLGQPRRRSKGTVTPGTMSHVVLRMLGTGRWMSARQMVGTLPFPQSPRNSWGQRLIELRACGLVAEHDLEDVAGETPAMTFGITDRGRAVLDVLEGGGTWKISA